MCEARRRGALLAVANRTEERAMELAREFGARFISRDELRLSRFDIIINATSVGMFPHVKESPLPRSLLKARVVFDAVYNPPITRLLRDAKQAGARIVQGTEMYLNQAAVQSELFTGRRPDVGMMRRVLAKHL
jgi:3-dehydroquinate dehydratase/shikimate dehydrogenase